MLTRYEVGQASVEDGSDIVKGYCTSWLTYITVGSTLHIAGLEAKIAEVLEIDRLRLEAPWSEGTTEPSDYHIDIFNGDQVAPPPPPPAVEA